MVESIISDHYNKIYKSDLESNRIKWFSKEHIKMIREEPEYLVCSIIFMLLAIAIILFENYKYLLFVSAYAITIPILIISHNCRKDKYMKENYKKLCRRSYELKELLANEFNIVSKEQYAFVLEEIRRKPHISFKKIFSLGASTIIPAAIFICGILGDMYGARNGLLMFLLTLDLMLFLCGVFLIIDSFVKDGKKRSSLKALESELVYLIAMCD